MKSFFKKEKEPETFERESNFFQKVDRIITGNTKIKVVNQLGELAFTNLRSKEIILGFLEIGRMVDNDKTRFIALSKGLNYHELAHIMHTRLSTRIIQSLTSQEFSIMNAIEDGRIETLFSQKYPRAEKYFINAFHQLIHKIAKEQEKISPLTFLSSQCRHLFLDKKSLATYEAIFSDAFGDQTTNEIKILIDEYLTSKSISEQAKIIIKICDKIRKIDPNQSLPSMSNSSSLTSGKEDYDEKDIDDIEGLTITINSSKKNSSKTTKLSESMKKKISELMKSNKIINEIAEKEKQLSKDYAEMSNKRYDKINDIKRKEIELKNSKLTDESKKKISDEIEQTQKEVEELTKKKNSWNEESSKNYAKRNKAIDDMRMIEKELSKEIDKETEQNNDELESANAEANNECDQDLKTIYQDDSAGFGAGDGETINQSSALPFNPQNHHRIIAKKLTDTLKKIQNDKRKGYIDHQKTGKINIGRAMNFPKTADASIFKRYEPDKTRQTKIGVVILIDRSGSMSGTPYDQAFETAWTIDQAVTRTGNKTIIIEFNHTHRVIKNYEDRKGNWTKNNFGNTNPTTALTEARRLMRHATKKHKIKNWLVYILTDGQWDGNIRTEERIIESMNKTCETHLIFLGNRKDAQVDGHKCKQKSVIKTIYELEPLLQKNIQKTALQIRKKIER